MRQRSSLLPFLVALASLTAAAPTEDTSLKISAGPKTISEDERALADSAGAVVLLDEMAIDDSAGFRREVRRHVRAKILRNEGRDLADVEIPMFAKGDRLIDFWGRTLLPDGRVLEVSLENVVYQRIAKQGRWYRFRYARVALPGVIPGTVIDFGYTLREDHFSFLERVDLQQRWPMRSLRLRWRPWSGDFATAYRLWNAQAVNPAIAQEGRTIRLTVQDVPGFETEPFMPPVPQVRPSVALYYLSNAPTPRAYWGFRAAEEQGRMTDFFEDDASLREVVGGWNLPSTMPVEKKLEHAFGWIGDHVRNVDLTGSAEVRADVAATEGKDRAARHVLAEREGDSWEIAALFAGFAKVLGAQAVPVLAPDRTWQIWDVEVAAPFRFDEVLLGVKSGEKLTLCAPGRGLAYGDVPWWTTGVPAPSPSGVVQAPAPSPRQSLQDVSGTLTFPESGVATLEWTRRLTGQQALDARQAARQEKQEGLDTLCGADDRVEVVSAKAEGLDQLTGEVRVHCSASTQATDLPGENEDDGTEAGGYEISLLGPWVSAPPDFEGRTQRRHPIVFPYPRVDTARIEVAAPAGFEPAPEPPAPVTLDTPYGRYKRVVTRTDRGFVVERGYALTALAVPATEYAALRDFFDGIRRADRATVKFVRRQAAE